MEMEFIPIQQILMDFKDRMQMKSQRRLRDDCTLQMYILNGFWF